MLVPTMTPEEIYAEMYKDAEWLQDRITNRFILPFDTLLHVVKEHKD